MKSRVILILLVCLNAGLLTAFLVGRRPASEPVPAAPTAVTKTETRVVTDERAPRIVESLVTNAFNWAVVESPDYKQYIANLRAIGCPEETIRDIIIADVSKLYGAKIAALRPSPQDFKFWKTNDRESRNADREREQQARELEREKRALLKELLGVDLEVEMAEWSGRGDRDEWRYGWLPEAKQEQLRVLRDKYRELERAVFAEGGGWNPENRAKFLALRGQHEAEMAQLLTPQEFEEYQLRNSWTARNMRENLVAFQPAETEFREIFNLRKAFDDQFGMLREGGDDAVREQRRLAEQHLEEQIKALLGDQRYKDYTLAQDGRFRDIYDFTQRNDLPKSTAEQVYQMRLLAEGERRRLEQDQSIPADQRQALLLALGNETRSAVNTVLGNTFDDYLRRDGGWLTRLARTGDNRDRNREWDGRRSMRR